MKKIILLTAILIIHASCSTEKKAMDTWVGKTKQSFIKSWGSPVRTLNNDKNGEILIFADQVYAISNHQHSSTMAGSYYWNYMFVYVNTEGKVASWRKEKQVFPPQQINAGELTGTNSLSVK
ncbi:MAG: hypothetical protein ABI793_06860 [Flavobacterium sp.]